MKLGCGDGNATGERWIDDDVAFHDALEVADQFTAVDSFQDVTGSVHPQGLIDVLLILVDGQEHDLQVRELFVNAPAQVESTVSAEPDVAQQNIWLLLRNKGESVGLVGGHADNLDVLIEVPEHGADTV